MRKISSFLHERGTLRDTKMPDCKYLIAGIKIFFGIKYPLLFPIGVFPWKPRKRLNSLGVDVKTPFQRFIIDAI